MPVRARYGYTRSWGIGINPLTSERPLWYTLADAAASKLLSEKSPRVLRAIRLEAEGGPLPDLRPVEMPGGVRIDPRRQDFFRAVVEERRKLAQRGDLSARERERADQFLKVLANSASYGIYAETIRHERPGKRRRAVRVHGLDEFTDRVLTPESPGEFAFPPMAACITGAAKLMLALLERRVAQAGGSYAFCDTDSMAVVATKDGGLVPCRGGAEKSADGMEAVKALSWERGRSDPGPTSSGSIPMTRSSSPSRSSRSRTRTSPGQVACVGAAPLLRDQRQALCALRA